VAASFPSGLKPTSRSYRPGKFPQVAFEALNGATTMIRYGQKPYNAQLTLTFANISDTDADRILDHYEERMATFSDVTFDMATGLAGMDLNLAFRLGQTFLGSTGFELKWRYAEPPQVESVYRGISTVTCTFTGYLDGV